MRYIFLILLLNFGFKLVYAQTKIPTTISTNTILTKSKSPYIIDSNVTVNKGVTLKVEAGCIVKIGSGLKLIVNGNLIVAGTVADSVYFMTNTTGKSWSSIESTNANIAFYYSNISSVKRFINASGGDSIIIAHCKIESKAIGKSGEDCIAAHDTKIIRIFYSTIKGAGGTIASGSKNDAIDLDTADSCFIFNNEIYNFSDDAIDIGTTTKYTDINFCKVHHSNYGITIGESSIAYLNSNISYHNDVGIQVHTKATVYVNKNTLYSNTDGLECYHSEEGDSLQTGGSVYVKNTVFFENSRYEITKQKSSFIAISNSISNKEILTGESNLKGDPLLVDPNNGDFSLSGNSPCINAGSDKLTIGAVDFVNNTSNIIGENKLEYFLFPNPVNSSFHIGYNSRINFQITGTVNIFDNNGRLVMQNKYGPNQNIYVETLKKGIYYICIHSENSNISYLKFVKN
jgi:hypothetical protein